MRVSIGGRRRWVLLVLALSACAVLAGRAGRGYRSRLGACIPGPGSILVCAAPDGAKLPNHGRVPLLSASIDPRRKGGVRLEAARDETVAFELILKATSSAAVDLTVSPSDLAGPSGPAISAASVQLFLAHYVWVDPGGYTWGPPTRVLKWPDFYPDALVPFVGPCPSRTTLVPSVRVPTQYGSNQMIWVDIHVPREQPPGSYSGRVVVEGRGETVGLPVEVRVTAATLPEAPSLDAVAELYDAYAREGAGTDMAAPAWRAMAQCYQQMAHAHRTVFIERLGGVGEDWRDYDLTFGPALDGTLFTPQHGYTGPGAGAPVSVWRTPWPQKYNGRLDAPLSDTEIGDYERLARSWDRHSAALGWDHTRYFAYVFDEIDGPTDEKSVDSGARDGYLAMAHREMARVQRALDRGAVRHPIDLLWTSHSNPSAWVGKPGIDLTGTIRLWCPNAKAAAPDFLARRASNGERAWFYHAGHPYVGAHSINVPGTDMRTWGVIAARYGLQGMLMWAANLGDPENPYNKPSYKSGEDRFGNGTLVYPGNLLSTIGLPATPGPIPSVRLKMWRRGIQDADLASLAREAGRGGAVDELLRETVPRALAEGHGAPAWSSDLQVWDSFHRRLLDLAQP